MIIDFLYLFNNIFVYQFRINNIKNIFTLPQLKCSEFQNFF